MNDVFRVSESSDANSAAFSRLAVEGTGKPGRSSGSRGSAPRWNGCVG